MICVSLTKTWQMGNICVGDNYFPFLNILALFFLSQILLQKNVVVLFILCKTDMTGGCCGWHAMTMKCFLSACTPSCLQSHHNCAVGIYILGTVLFQWLCCLFVVMNPHECSVAKGMRGLMLV
jgi:hypothetical protein